MYAATTKDEGNAADGRFSTARKDLTPLLFSWFLLKKFHPCINLGSILPLPIYFCRNREGK